MFDNFNLYLLLDFLLTCIFYFIYCILWYWCRVM